MILCGVDDSDEAAQAARFAADLAVQVGTRLVLLHVAAQPWVSIHTPESAERMREQEAFERAGHLGTVVNPIQVDPAASVERVVEFGRPDEVLRSVAEELGATHLVVGSRGQGAVEEVLAASTSGALAREAPCPVILVPAEPARWSEGSADATIVCGVDGSDGSLAAARQAGELAQRLDARLVLATVLEDVDVPGCDAVVEDLRAAAPGIRIEVERSSGRATDQLLELARTREARLLVVGSRGRGAVKAAVLGSVSGRLVQEADRPVMVVSKRAAATS
jgi:nucleotide-binding universal stress UspA family protein